MHAKTITVVIMSNRELYTALQSCPQDPHMVKTTIGYLLADGCLQTLISPPTNCLWNRG